MNESSHAPSLYVAASVEEQQEAQARMKTALRRLQYLEALRWSLGGKTKSMVEGEIKARRTSLAPQAIKSDLGRICHGEFAGVGHTVVIVEDTDYGFECRFAILNRERHFVTAMLRVDLRDTQGFHEYAATDGDDDA